MEMPPLEEAVARIREAERASAFVREHNERLRHEITLDRRTGEVLLQ